MKDPYNPTCQEIRDWAYSDALFPDQDWDIIVFNDVTDDELTAFVLDIASDASCPKQRTFVHFLNVLTGTVARYAAERGFAEAELTKLSKLIIDAEKKAIPLVVDWANRTRQVIQFPEKFRYEDWFG